MEATIGLFTEMNVLLGMVAGVLAALTAIILFFGRLKRWITGAVRDDLTGLGDRVARIEAERGGLATRADFTKLSSDITDLQDRSRRLEVGQARAEERDAALGRQLDRMTQQLDMLVEAFTRREDKQ